MYPLAASSLPGFLPSIGNPGRFLLQSKRGSADFAQSDHLHFKPAYLRIRHFNLKAALSKSRYTEVYNDINGDLVNFWRHIKQHPEAFVTELNQYLVSREMFDTFTQHEPKTELERAIRFYFQLSCSYGSRSKNFCIMQGY
ncbi:MAG: DNA adenine methylase, partial [Proteiniphilum sp.]|nr:DNA adenine methylase [Proteiniphilum sp.]